MENFFVKNTSTRAPQVSIDPDIRLWNQFLALYLSEKGKSFSLIIVWSTPFIFIVPYNCKKFDKCPLGSLEGLPQIVVVKQ